MQLLLDHPDSPYIRCIGFLYLRYTCPPSMVWNWIKPYAAEDDVRFVVTRQSGRDKEVTMGHFVRLLFDMNSCEYYGTRLPRLESSVARELQVKLLRISKLEKRAESHVACPTKMEYLTTVGNKIRALYEDANTPSLWYDAVVDRVQNTDNIKFSSPQQKPKFVVTFPAYGNTELVTLGEIDMPFGYNIETNNRGKLSDLPRRGDLDHYQREEWGDNNKKKRKYSDENRGYNHRNPHNYCGNEIPGKNFGNIECNNDEQDLMGEVLRQEQDRTTTGQKRSYYASRPPTTKDSLSSLTNNNNCNYWKMEEKVSYSQTFRRKENTMDKISDSNANTLTQQSEPKARTREELAAIAERKQKLLTRYG